MPRLGLLLLLPVACAAPEERAVQALTEALAANRASLANASPAVPLSSAVLEVPTPRATPGGMARALPDEVVFVAPGTAEAVVPPASSTAVFGPASAARRRPAAGPPPRSAGQLLGAGPDAVRRWLGEPSLRRPEGGAEVWLYLAPACALDLVLYRERGGLTVAHAAARAQDAAGTRVTEAECLAGIAGGDGAGGDGPAAAELAPDARRDGG